MIIYRKLTCAYWFSWNRVTTAFSRPNFKISKVQRTVSLSISLSSLCLSRCVCVCLFSEFCTNEIVYAQNWHGRVFVCLLYSISYWSFTANCWCRGWPCMSARMWECDRLCPMFLLSFCATVSSIQTPDLPSSTNSVRKKLIYTWRWWTNARVRHKYCRAQRIQRISGTVWNGWL